MKQFPKSEGKLQFNNNLAEEFFSAYIIDKLIKFLIKSLVFSLFFVYKFTKSHRFSFTLINWQKNKIKTESFAKWGKAFRLLINSNHLDTPFEFTCD